MHKYTEKNIFFDIFWQKGKNKIYHYFKKKSNLKMLSLVINTIIEESKFINDMLGNVNKTVKSD